MMGIGLRPAKYRVLSYRVGIAHPKRVQYLTHTILLLSVIYWA